MVSNLFKAIVVKPIHTSYDGEDDDEHILYVFRKSLWTNLGWLIMTCVLAAVPSLLSTMLIYIKTPTFDSLPATFTFNLTVFWYLVVFGYAFANFTHWFFNIYIITDKKIIDMDFYGLLYKHTSETPLRNIEDVTSNVKGLFQTAFNIGTVFIQTAAEQTEFEFEMIPEPEKTRDIISDLIAKIRTESE